MAETDTFRYTYSAPRQVEVQQIRQKYLPKEVSKLDQLRALDRSVAKRGLAVSLVHGTLFSLILGLGMSCCLVWADVLFVPGIVIGCIGLTGVITTYPVYTRTVARSREKVTPEILRLSNELMNETI